MVVSFFPRDCALSATLPNVSGCHDEGGTIESQKRHNGNVKVMPPS
jgi:hypothetical protein